MQLLTLLLDVNDDFDGVIYYGKKAIENMEVANGVNFISDLYFALARAYFHKYSSDDLKNALKYINLCIESSKDEFEIDYLLIKVDILIGLKEFDKAKLAIDDVQHHFGSSGPLYYIKEKLNFAMGLDIKQKDLVLAEEYFTKAIEYLDIYEKYSTDKILIAFTKVEILNQLKRYDDSLKLLDEVTNDENEVEVMIEKIKIYEYLEQYETAVDLCREYLKTKISTLRSYRNLVNKKSEIKITINYHLWKIVSDVVKKYAVRIGVGRRKGMGRCILYNNKHYTSIQSCANEYGISKQAMHKRLKKLNII